MFELNKIYHTDARKLDSILTAAVVDVTITSPPYFDMKDYGHPNQIGFGQDYQEYLDDLYIVFSKVYDATKESGTLWVIIDILRKNGETILLPFDFANKIKSIGWILQEIIIWEKDRTVPWAHIGQMRNSFEYILVFSKSQNFKFNVDEIRDFRNLKKWWIKYPERYNPKGKTPEAIWNFGIPTQGSWGNGYIRHFCPLPEDLIAQILRLTTTENDVVLDPFAGSGAVLSKADNMKRGYVGFELNPDYIEMFVNYVAETGVEKRRKYEVSKQDISPREEFERLILDLRALKFSRILFTRLEECQSPTPNMFYVEPWQYTISKKNVLVTVTYKILITDHADQENILQAINEIVQKQPLSKYGIDPEFIIYSDFSDLIGEIEGDLLFSYTKKITHKYVNKHMKTTLSIDDLSEKEIILSPIKVVLDEKDYA